MGVLTNFFVVISLQYACVPHHCTAYVSYTMLCISYISINWRQQNQYKHQEQVGCDLRHLPKRKYWPMESLFFCRIHINRRVQYVKPFSKEILLKKVITKLLAGPRRGSSQCLWYFHASVYDAWYLAFDKDWSLKKIKLSPSLSRLVIQTLTIWTQYPNRFGKARNTCIYFSEMRHMPWLPWGKNTR